MEKINSERFSLTSFPRHNQILLQLMIVNVILTPVESLQADWGAKFTEK